MRIPIATLVLMMLKAMEVIGQGHEIEIQVSKIGQVKGQIIIAIYDAPEHFLTKQIRDWYAFPVTGPEDMSQVIDGLLDGIYAISVYHDVNGNGRLDTNPFGVPREPVGFSNNPRSLLGPPKFKKASFVIPSKTKKLVVELQ